MYTHIERVLLCPVMCLGPCLSVRRLDCQSVSRSVSFLSLYPSRLPTVQYICSCHLNIKEPFPSKNHLERISVQRNTSSSFACQIYTHTRTHTHAHTHIPNPPHSSSLKMSRTPSSSCNGDTLIGNADGEMAENMTRTYSPLSLVFCGRCPQVLRVSHLRPEAKKHLESCFPGSHEIEINWALEDIVMVYGTFARRPGWYPEPLPSEPVEAVNFLPFEPGLISRCTLCGTCKRTQTDVADHIRDVHMPEPTGDEGVDDTDVERFITNGHDGQVVKLGNDVCYIAVIPHNGMLHPRDFTITLALFWTDVEERGVIRCVDPRIAWIKTAYRLAFSPSVEFGLYLFGDQTMLIPRCWLGIEDSSCKPSGPRVQEVSSPEEGSDFASALGFDKKIESKNRQEVLARMIDPGWAITNQADYVTATFKEALDRTIDPWREIEYECDAVTAALRAQTAGDIPGKTHTTGTASRAIGPISKDYVCTTLHHIVTYLLLAAQEVATSTPIFSCALTEEQRLVADRVSQANWSKMKREERIDLVDEIINTLVDQHTPDSGPGGVVLSAMAALAIDPHNGRWKTATTFGHRFRAFILAVIQSTHYLSFHLFVLLFRWIALPLSSDPRSVAAIPAMATAMGLLVDTPSLYVRVGVCVWGAKTRS